MLLVSKLANSPEFSCGDSFGSNMINCVDLDKVMVLNENSNKYRNFWGISGIEVRKTYPGSAFDSDVVCDRNSYPNCNIIRLGSEEVKGTYISNFVSLCRKEKSEDGERIYSKCELGKLMVSYENEG